jgi:rubrerythrin
MEVHADNLNSLLGAIQAEIEANTFYTSLARRVKHASAREKLLRLAHDELGHREALTGRFRKIAGKDPDLSLPGSGPRLLDVLQEHPLNEQSDVAAILNTAILTEKDASEFYRQQMIAAGDAEGKVLFQQLAEMEEGHRTWLEAEYQKLAGGLYWFDVATPGIMEE